MYSIAECIVQFIVLPLSINNVILANLQSNNGVRFENCTPIEGFLYVSEKQEVGTELLDINQCFSYDGSLQDVTLKICGDGNEILKDEASGYIEPFALIDGVLSSKAMFNLDYHKTFVLCIQAVENEDCGKPIGDCLSLEVVIKDEDYHVPTFTGKIVGISEESPYHSPVIQVTTIDGSTNIIYRIEKLMYRSETGTSTEAEDVFVIDSNDGLIRTNKVHLLDYTNGYFEILIVVVNSDSLLKIDAPIVNVFIVKDSQIQRMTIKDTPRDVTDNKNVMISRFNHMLGFHMVVNNLRYHILKNSYGVYDGKFDNKYTDMCFHAIREKVLSGKTVHYIMDPKDVQKLFSDYKHNLTTIVKDYDIVTTEDGVIDVTDCEIKLETYKWSNHWWLWWLIVAEAIFIFLVAIVLIIALCYCYRRAKDKLPRTNAYTILDPFIIPYQYIEKTAQM